MSISEIGKNIKSLLAESQIEEALDLLQHFMENHSASDLDTVIHLKSGYKRIKSDRLKNIISNEAYEIELSRTVNGILELLKHIEAPKAPAVNTGVKRLSYLKKGATVLVVVIGVFYLLIMEGGPCQHSDPEPSSRESFNKINALSEKLNNDRKEADRQMEKWVEEKSKPTVAESDKNTSALQTPGNFNHNATAEQEEEASLLAGKWSLKDSVLNDLHQLERLEMVFDFNHTGELSILRYRNGHLDNSESERGLKWSVKNHILVMHKGAKKDSLSIVWRHRDAILVIPGNSMANFVIHRK